MIRKLKYNNHSVLGNLELNFEKDQTANTIYATIVFAGENGTGKSTIMETISKFLAGGSFCPFQYIDCIVSGKNFTLLPHEKHSNQGVHYRTTSGTSEKIYVGSLPALNKSTNDVNDIRHYGSAYSKARTNFNTRDIKSIGTSRTDSKIHETDDNDDFTSLKQLLIDLSSQDNANLRRIARENNGVPQKNYANFVQASKLHRFEQAFNGFFENIKLLEEDNENNPGMVDFLFEKNGNQILIDNLSSGEKQIVFRGASLLKNVKNMENGTIFVDEPELSMHPKWQRKILNYYKTLFTANNIQKVQMFFATHSEEVVKTALNTPDTLVIVLNENEDGSIVPTYLGDGFKLILPFVSSAEVNYHAFGITSNDLHTQLYEYLRTTASKKHQRELDKYIRSHKLYDEKRHSTNYKDRGSDVAETLPTYIRNYAAHPIHDRVAPSDEQLQNSTDLLITLCKEF